MKNKNLKSYVILSAIIVIFIFLFIFINNYNKKDNLEKNLYLKDYKINEYIPTYVSDEDMAKIYLNDYIHTMYYNVEEAYNLLDEEYRNLKFGSIEAYKIYVNNLGYSNYTLEKYYKISKDGYLFFGVYDKNNNIFIFKTNGVMQYSVYLDDYTIEI